MGYTIFISHSNEDTEIVDYISAQLQYYEITPIIAQYERPEKFPQYLPEKIKNLIQKSDCVAVLLTKNSIDSNWVQQEIGYVLDKKPLIPLVDGNIPSSELGFLQGAEFIHIYREDFNRSMSKLLSWTVQLKAEKEEKELLKAIGALIIIGLILWWLSKKE